MGSVVRVLEFKLYLHRLLASCPWKSCLTCVLIFFICKVRGTNKGKKSLMQKLNEILHAQYLAQCLAHSECSVNVCQTLSPMARLNSLVLQAQAGEVPPGNRGFCLIARAGIPAGGTYDMGIKDYEGMASVFCF